MYSASIIESVIMDCLALLQTTIAPPRVTLNRMSTFSNPYLIENQSQVYPKGFRSPPEHISIKFLILLRYFRMIQFYLMFDSWV